MKRRQKISVEFFALLLLAAINSIDCRAQYIDNPLKDSRWASLSGGASTADFVSWQTGVSYAFRGESLITQMRAMYSQELIDGPTDSIFASRNRLAEFGLMWGDGWGGRYWYVSGTIGMGVNVRMYGDSALQDKESFRYMTAVTIGVPAQIEAGVWVSDSFGLNLTFLGNWNFRQPYIAGHVGFVYRLRKQTGGGSQR